MIGVCARRHQDKGFGDLLFVVHYAMQLQSKVLSETGQLEEVVILTDEEGQQSYAQLDIESFCPLRILTIDKLSSELQHSQLKLLVEAPISALYLLPEIVSQLPADHPPIPLDHFDEYGLEEVGRIEAFPSPIIARHKFTTGFARADNGILISKSLRRAHSDKDYQEQLFKIIRSQLSFLTIQESTSYQEFCRANDLTIQYARDSYTFATENFLMTYAAALPEGTTKEQHIFLVGGGTQKKKEAIRDTLQFFADKGFNKVIVVEDDQETTILNKDDEPTIRIYMKPSLPYEAMQSLTTLATQGVVGCTGDQSLGDSLSAGHIISYECLEHKRAMYTNLCRALISQLDELSDDELTSHIADGELMTIMATDELEEPLSAGENRAQYAELLREMITEYISIQQANISAFSYPQKDHRLAMLDENYQRLSLCFSTPYFKEALRNTFKHLLTRNDLIANVASRQLDNIGLEITPYNRVLLSLMLGSLSIKDANIFLPIQPEETLQTLIDKCAQQAPHTLPKLVMSLAAIELIRVASTSQLDLLVSLLSAEDNKELMSHDLSELGFSSSTMGLLDERFPLAAFQHSLASSLAKHFVSLLSQPDSQDEATRKIKQHLTTNSPATLAIYLKDELDKALHNELVAIRQQPFEKQLATITAILNTDTIDDLPRGRLKTLLQCHHDEDSLRDSQIILYKKLLRESIRLLNTYQNPSNNSTRWQAHQSLLQIIQEELVKEVPDFLKINEELGQDIATVDKSYSFFSTNRNYGALLNRVRQLLPERPYYNEGPYQPTTQP